MTMHQRLVTTLRATTVAGALLTQAMPQALAAPSCSARSGERRVHVVELYTSEGCNSCPPADRWLQQIARGPSVVALAFHVDYWDHLGWADRFGSPAHTDRQTLQRAVNGARFSYTPQVVVDGRDRPDWQRLGALDNNASVTAQAPAPPPSPTTSPTTPPASVTIELQRQGRELMATVQFAPSAQPAPSTQPARPRRLAAYWALTEDGHQSAVKSGENAGVLLRHDHVVRDYQPVPAWLQASEQATPLRYTPRLPADPAHPQRITLVVVDGDTGRPLQAVSLGC